ncbi:gfo/Idh/MocA family oxidoreductase [Rhodohalobacter sp. SW132]|uniref:Gfo/Idh/MocA family protein n=1 Tax=Rhodohalobacter sp. SW132 TaxID=2293433 RepID=UPI000E232ECB|nr:Gfo/Idh/MocA family oxidoreductase [Rhodohalobacter sp. SW132]REL32902.1 gfo/Idh/MocA family oxidoreductase [Rhodohalobacter sp. SW132]
MKSFPDSEVRWGILGAGDVCEVKSAPVMNIIEHSKLVAVMRRTGEKAKDYAERHQVPKWYDDADKLLNDPDINAIYIATPPDAHEYLAKKAFAAGKPVYVEKPMARTSLECRSMIAASSQAGLPLYVAYYRRALPNFLKIKALVDKGVIGDVRLVNIQLHKPANPDLVAKTDNDWRVKPEVAGGGYFYDLASHQLDFLDFLLGPIETATGFAGNQAGLYEANDIVTGSFRFENGVMGTGSWCFTASDASSIDQTIITGNLGQITYPTFDGSDVVLETDKNGRETFEFDLPKHIQQPLIQLVVDDLLGMDECPSTGVTGARTNNVMELITR